VVSRGVQTTRQLFEGLVAPTPAALFGLDSKGILLNLTIFCRLGSRHTGWLEENYAQKTSHPRKPNQVFRDAEDREEYGMNLALALRDT
jgi:hypothetical protein